MNREERMDSTHLRRIVPGVVVTGLSVTLMGCDGLHPGTGPSFEAPIAGALVVNQRNEVDTVLTNFCTGEDVHISGTSHVVFSITTSRTGGFHLAFTSNQQLGGTGLTTGASYLSVSSSSFSLNVDSLPFQQTSVGSSRLLRQGAGGDIMSFFLQHITVDANGNTRVFNTDFRFTCT
jgi:hypothetical protein